VISGRFLIETAGSLVEETDMARLPEKYQKDDLAPEHQHIHDYLVKTRGRVSPGFGAILNKPEVAILIAQLGTHIRFENELPDNVRELTALTASAELEGVYEQGLHTHDAAEKGVAQSVIDAVNAKSDALPGATEAEAIAVRCARELTRSHDLSDEAFEQARQRFGDSGVVELIATIGYYSMLAYVHNGLRAGR
jgi:4-carboxymuconolactone decarboxylase